MKYIPSLRSFTSVFFNELLFNISKSTTMRSKAKPRSDKHMHMFFLPTSRFLFAFTSRSIILSDFLICYLHPLFLYVVTSPLFFSSVVFLVRSSPVAHCWNDKLPLFGQASFGLEHLFSYISTFLFLLHANSKGPFVNSFQYEKKNTIYIKWWNMMVV